MTFWSAEELAAMNVVEFTTTDARGQPITFKTPVCAKVVCGPRPLVWNVQQGMGLSGAVARFGGIGLAKGSITLTMGTPEQRQIYDLFCKKYLVAPVQGQPAKVYTVKHPRFGRIGLTRLHLTEEPAGDWNEQTQIETVVYQFEEDRKPLPTLSSSTTAGQTKDGAKAKNDTRTALQAAIKQNSEQISALTAQLQQ